MQWWLYKQGRLYEPSEDVAFGPCVLRALITEAHQSPWLTLQTDSGMPGAWMSLCACYVLSDACLMGCIGDSYRLLAVLVTVPVNMVEAPA